MSYHKDMNIKSWQILFLITFITAYLSLLTVPAWAQTASLSVSPTSGTFNQGCTFSVEVKVDTGGAQTDGTDAILFYDPTRFTAKTIRNGTIYQSYPQSNIFEEEGKIAIAGVASVGSPFQGAGTMATIDFEVVEEAPAGLSQLKFDFDPNDKEKTADSNIVDRATTSDILSKVNNGSYTVGTGTCGKTSTVKPIGGTSDSAKVVPTLPQSGAFENTVVLAVVGGALIIIGILGLLIL